jgi:ATP-binding cassette subfamily B protein
MGYLRLMFSPLMRFSFHQATLERAKASAIRIVSLLDDTPTILDSDVPRQFSKLTDSIEFDNVSFAYESDVPVLTGLSLSIKAGSNIGIVGATGSGKSTLLNLLLRFRDPISGQITFDGVPLTEVAIESLRRSTGLVHQDVLLFPGTVLDNLGGDREAAQRSLDLLGLEISLGANLSMGGENLSRGERQLITFARAIVGDPSLLILDEATSAIDPATEGRIQAALGTIVKGRTTVTVAHRLATVSACDTIFLMSKGAVVEKGSHAQLIQDDGEYASLWRLQEGAVG